MFNKVLCSFFLPPSSWNLMSFLFAINLLPSRPLAFKILTYSKLARAANVVFVKYVAELQKENCLQLKCWPYNQVKKNSTINYRKTDIAYGGSKWKMQGAEKEEKLRAEWFIVKNFIISLLAEIASSSLLYDNFNKYCLITIIVQEYGISLLWPSNWFDSLKTFKSSSTDFDQLNKIISNKSRRNEKILKLLPNSFIFYCLMLPVHTQPVVLPTIYCLFSH